MLLKSIMMRNILSFGPETQPLELANLNVLIGPNGSGKSNLVDGISFLRAAAGELAEPVRQSGGIRDWLWKGMEGGEAELNAVVDNPHGQMALRHVLAFRETAQRFDLLDERIENERPYPGETGPYFFYRYQSGAPVLNVRRGRRELRPELVKADESIVSQRRDPEEYPEITHLAEQYKKIGIFRDWSFSRANPLRQPQPADQNNAFLAEDFVNLGLVLNQLRREPPVKRRLVERLRDLYPDVDDFEINVEGGTVQIFLQEGDFAIPATRLSDGTLRYLCLLAMLCHPKPPPLMCIEEPELGLHPDIMPMIADLLVEASERTQLVVTTHSDVLVDALSDHPDAIVVCEKHDGCTTMRRLEPDALREWLARYSLGQLWRKGQLGGNRW